MLEFDWLFADTAVLATAVFVFGLLIGSFLNVVILAHAAAAGVCVET